MELAIVEPPVRVDPAESMKRVLWYPITVVVTPVPPAPSRGLPLPLPAREDRDRSGRSQPGEPTWNGPLVSCARPTRPRIE
jgi:hypothetical protein